MENIGEQPLNAIGDDAPPRADEFDDKGLEEFSLKYQLVCLVKNGKSPREALDHLGIKGTDRWVRKLCERYKFQGARGLLDGRLKNKSNRRLFTDEVKQIVLSWWYARPGAGPKAIWEEVRKECSERQIPCPKYDVVKKFLQNQSPHDKLVRAGKIHIWDKEGRPVVRFNMTSRSNERWQVDHTRADIWIREKIGDRWQPSEAYLSVAIDAHSRAIAGIWLSKRTPDSWTVAMLLRNAILPKAHKDWIMQGIPRVYQPDRGKDLMANSVALSLGYLGIERDPDPPHYPNRKGKIERWFLTLDRGCLRMLPGHMSAIGVTKGAAEKRVAELLEISDLRKEIIHYIVENYHRRTHSETGRKPIEFWQETVDLRLPESEDALNAFLFKSDKIRRVRNTGIKFTLDGFTGHYWSPQLVNYWRQDVQLRYNPEDLNSMLIYRADNNEFICEAFLMGKEDSRYNIHDVKRERNQYRRGLLERHKQYAQKVEEFDRPRKQAEQREKAQQLLEQQNQKEKQAVQESMDELRDVRNLLSRLERRGRGED